MAGFPIGPEICEECGKLRDTCHCGRLGGIDEARSKMPVMKRCVLCGGKGKTGALRYLVAIPETGLKVWNQDGTLVDAGELVHANHPFTLGPRWKGLLNLDVEKIKVGEAVAILNSL